MRLLIYAILFYIIWKFVKVFMKYLSSSKKGKYTEIKDEDKDKDKE